MADEAQVVLAGPLGDAAASGDETPDQRAMRIYRSRMSYSLGALGVSLTVFVCMHWPWGVLTMPVGDTVGRAIAGYLMRRKLAPGLGWYEFGLFVVLDIVYMSLTARNWTACSLALHRHLGH